MSADTIVIAGFATLPEGLATKGSSNYFALEFEIERCNSVVMDVYCNLLPFVEKDILTRTCVGNRIDIGIEKAILELDKRFFGRTKRMIITAIEDAYECYRKVVDIKTTSPTKTKCSSNTCNCPIRRLKRELIEPAKEPVVC